MKKVKVSLDDLKLESYITSLDAEKADRIAGGAAGHPTHTEKTDKLHVCGGVQCASVIAPGLSLTRP